MCNEVFLEHDDPEAYVELLGRKNTHRIHNQPASRTTTLGPTFAASFQDDRLSQRFSRILDVLARACITRHGQVATTAASIEEKGDTIETTIFVSFNPHDRPDVDMVAKHVRDLFEAVKAIPVPQKIIQDSLPVDQSAINDAVVTFIRLIYDFGWDLWQYYVNKRTDALKVARAVVTEALANVQKHAEEGKREKEGQVGETLEPLTKKECEELLKLFLWLQDLSNPGRGLLRKINPDQKRAVLGTIASLYGDWLAKGYVDRAQDEILRQSATPKVTVLDKFENIMKHHEPRVYFPLKRWIAKIVSFHTHSLIFIRLAQSRRLQPILQGTLHVVVVPTPAPSLPLIVHLDADVVSSTVATARQAFGNYETKLPHRLDDPVLDTFVADFLYHITPFDNPSHERPFVHSELCMLEYLEENKIDFFSYFGVSKLPCAPCAHYLQAHAEDAGRPQIGTRGTNGKFYSAWLMPRSRDGVRGKMILSMKQELGKYLVEYVEEEWSRRLLDSSAGSVDHASATAIKEGPPLDVLQIMQDEYYQEESDADAP